MPKMDGQEVLKNIRQIENARGVYGFEGIKVIMVTANDGKRHQDYAETLGVDAYLHKPVRLERLITLAQDMLN